MANAQPALKSYELATPLRAGMIVDYDYLGCDALLRANAGGVIMARVSREGQVTLTGYGEYARPALTAKELDALVSVRDAYLAWLANERLLEDGEIEDDWQLS